MEKNEKNIEETQTEPKKVSLAEAAKQALARKKQSNQKQQSFHDRGNHTMKSQHMNKPKSQRKKMGP
ncbi:hypothetical protein [Bacillus horti]|uniref:Uncharacterized protein n=1 Tax=Caldalkalibacillus horti TaxID=77523 RepID=A0ABT9W550_9BACI|nr:hypothetical protein [Bacillus horti]MDQ0168372.1 hypothetical protein [Bacillus horti]